MGAGSLSLGGIGMDGLACIHTGMGSGDLAVKRQEWGDGQPVQAKSAS